jgi:hypothetical protein
MPSPHEYYCCCRECRAARSVLTAITEPRVGAATDSRPALGSVPFGLQPRAARTKDPAGSGRSSKKNLQTFFTFRLPAIPESRIEET